MSPEAVSAQLRQVEDLRRLCLSLARSSATRELIEKHPDNENLRRLRAALGRGTT